MAARWLQQLFGFRSSAKSPRHRTTSSGRIRLHLEELEQRLAPATYTWTPTAAGTFDWNNKDNWGGVGVPNAVGDVANLTSALAGNETINLNGPITIGTLYIGASSGSNTFTIAPNSGSLTLDDGSGSAAINKTRGGADLISAPITLSAATTLTDSSSTGLTVSGVISGSNSLTKDGSGIDVLGAANTYTGATIIDGGALSVGILADGGTASGIGASSNAAANLVLDGGALRYTGSADAVIDRLFSVGTSGGTIDSSGSGRLLFNNTGTIGFNGQIGPRTLTLTGSNTTTIGSPSDVNLQITDDSGNNPTSIIKSGSGTWGLVRFTNSYSGDTTISNGRLIALQPNVIPGGTGKGNVSVALGATLELDFSDTINGLSGAGTIDNGPSSNTLTVGGNDQSSTFSGIIENTSSSLAVTKIGTGTLTLTGTSTYSGGTTINGGTLSISADSNLGTTPGSATPGQLVLNGGTLQATAGFTLNSKRGIALGAASGSGGGTIDVTGGNTLTYGGIVADNGSGTGSLTLTDSGTLNLTGANTYSGGTDFSSGTLLVGSNTALGTGTITMNGGTLMPAASGLTLTNNFSFSGSPSTTSFIDTANGDFALNGNFTGSGDVTKLQSSGAHSLRLGGDNSGYSGTFTVAGGGNNSNLFFTTNTAGSASAAWVLTGTAQNILGVQTAGNLTVQLGALASAVTNGTLQVQGGGTATFQVGALNTTTTYAGVIGSASGSVSLTKAGTGTLILSGSNSYSGGTTVSGGNLTFSNQAIPAGTVNIASGAALQYDDSSNVTQGTITFTGNGTLLKTGTGALIFGDGTSGNITWQLGAGALIDVQGGTLVGGRDIEDVWTNDLASLNIAAGATFAGVEANVRVDALTGTGTLSTGYAQPSAHYSTFTIGVNGDAAGQYNNHTAGTATFSGTIADDGSANPGNLTKIGSGTQFLAGADTYSGGTTIDAGTLVAATPAGTALGSGTVTEAGGTLSFNPGTGQSPLALTGFNQDGVYAEADSSASAGTTTAFDAANNVFYEAGVSGSPGAGLPTSRSFSSAANSAIAFELQPYSQNNVLLLNQNTPTGTLTLSTPGQFQALNFLVASASAGPGGANYNLALHFTDGTSDTLSANGTPITYNAADWFNGTPYALAGFNRVTRSDTFDTQTSNPRLYEQDVTLSSTDQAKAISSITFTSSASGTAELGVFAVSGNWLATTGPSYRNSVVFSATSAIDVPSGVAATLAGVISGSSGLTKTSSGTLVLTGSNTHSGSTTIDAGTLRISADGNLGTAPGSATAGQLVLNGGTLEATATFMLNSHRGIALGPSNGSGSGTIDVTSGNTLTYYGIIANNGNGTGGLVTTDSGTLTLVGSNTYTGATTISGGTLAANNNSALGDNSAVTVASGATLSVNQLLGVDLALGSLTGNGSVELGRLTVGGDNTSTTFGGSISSGGLAFPTGLTKVGTGTLTLASTSTFSGATTIDAGTLQLATANALPSTTALTIQGTGTFDLDGINQSVGSLSDGGVTTGTLTNSNSSTPAAFTDNTNDTDTFAGSITGAVNLVMSGSGTLVLGGNNTYSGTTTVSSGTLQVGNDGSTGSLGSGSVSDDASLVFDFASDFTLATAIGGTGTLTLTSTGGAVRQSVPITMPTLTANASTGITLTNAGNDVGSFAATDSTTGDIDFTNATDLSVTGITQSGSGAINLLSTGTNTALTVNGTVTASGGSITLQATGDVTVAANQTVSNVTGSVTLSADLTPTGSGDDGIGSVTVSSSAQVMGAAVTLQGADANTASGATVSGGFGPVTTMAGSPDNDGYADGTGSAAQFSFPVGVATDSAGNVYVADTGNDVIRKITPAGVVTTLAGSPGNVGHADGTGSAAQFNGPTGVAVDNAGNVYVADTNNHEIREITPAGVVTTLAGSPHPGYADGTGSAAQFVAPTGVAVDSAGNVYVADAYSNVIRKITPAGVVTTLAGSPDNEGYADGTGSAADFESPAGVAVDSAGNVYVADTGNDVIREITPLGAVTTLAGSPDNFGYADGTGSAAQFAYPTGVAVDSAGIVYVADYYNGVIRKVTPAGVVTTLAGNGRYGYADGTGSAAQFYAPRGVAVDRAGKLYVADTGNEVIRAINLLPSAITIRSSLESLPMSIGGSNNAAVAGINLTNAELAGLRPGSGSLTIGDSSQTGNITLSTLSPALGVGASLAVVQSTTGTGQIILDDGAGTGAALDGAGDAITLTAGTGGIVEAATNTVGTPDIANASSVTLTSAGALGTGGQPLQLSDLSLATDTSANDSNQFLTAVPSFTATSLNAGSGTVNLLGGAVALAAPSGSMAADSLLDVNGSTVSIGALNQTVAALTLTSGSITGTTGVLTVPAPVIQVQSGSVSAILGGASGLTKTTSGAVVVSGANTYRGDTTISSGTLQLGAANALPSGGGVGNVVFNPASGTATLDLNGFNQTVNALLSSGAGSAVIDNTATDAVTLTVGSGNASGSFSGVIQNSGGTLNLTKIGTGIQTLLGNNTYDGATLISGGTLAAASGGALGSTFTGTSVASGATLDVQGTIAYENIQLAGSGVGGNGALISSTGTGSLNSAITLKANSAIGGAGNLAINGPISGGFGLTKVGSGTTTFAGTDSFTGIATINAGTLLVDGSLPASGGVTVGSGATLGGTGTVGAVTVSGGTVDPGDPAGAPGTLTVASADFSAGGTLLSRVASLSPSPSFNALNVTGALTLGGSSALTLDLNNVTTGGTAAGIVTYGSLTGSFMGVNVVNNSGGIPTSVIDNAAASRFDALVAVLPTTVGVTSSSTQNTSPYGNSVTFTATVTNTSGTADTPTGSVEFFDGSTDLGPGSNVSGSGTSANSTFTTATLPVGATPQTITAVYTSRGLFARGSGSVNQTVNPAPLSIAIVGTPSKSYDSTTAAALTPANYQLTGLVGSDSLTVTQTAGTYDTKDTNAATVSASLSANNFTAAAGTLASNYVLPTSASGAGTITPATLTITAVSDTKVYDGTTVSSKTPTFQVASVPANTLYGSNTVTGLSQVFASKNVLGSGLSTLEVTGYTVNDGNSGKDYTVTTVQAGGTITAAALTITANNISKTYGRPVNFAGTEFSASGLVNSDSASSVTLTSSGAAASATAAASPYPIVPSAAVGTGLANYDIRYVSGSLNVTAESTSTSVTSTGLSKTFSTANQLVALSASVSPGSAGGVTVNQGTVTFTVLNANNQTIATLSGSAVSGGSASASYDLAGLPADSYHIHAAYVPAADSLDYTASADATDGTLSVASDSTTTAVSATTSATFPTVGQSVSLSATVSPGNTTAGGVVNEGTVTFTVVDSSNHQIGSSVTSGTVTFGSASAVFALPGNTAIATYFIHAAYNAGSDFTPSSDISSGHLLIVKQNTTTFLSSTSTTFTKTFSTGSQTITLAATVKTGKGQVNEGTVMFILLNTAGQQVGNAVTSDTLSAGSASATYNLAGIPAGSYQIYAVYVPKPSNPDFNTSSDTVNGSLRVTKENTKTTVSSLSKTFAAASQTVQLTATVSPGNTPAGGAVNEGTVTFTILKGKTTLATLSGNAVSRGSANASYTLPGGLAVGSYHIHAVYVPLATSPDFNASADTTDGTLRVGKQNTATTVTSTGLSKPFSPTSNPVTLSASVSAAVGTVNEGTITFTILNSSNAVVAALSGNAVSGGNASAIHDLRGLPRGSYHIRAVYVPRASAPDFNTSADTTDGTLTVT